MAMTNLATKSVKAAGWVGMSQAVRLVLQFVVNVMLARLLRPSDFGLLAMVVVFTNLAWVFVEFGLSSALIQKQDLTEEHIHSSFWFNLAMGLGLTVLFAASAPFIASFYESPRLLPIIIAIAPTFLIFSFGIIPTSLLTKSLRFKPLAISETVAFILGGSAAVTMAFLGLGVWSLVWQQIIAALVSVFMLWSFTRWRVRFVFKWSRLKDLLGFGLNLTGFNFVNYFSRNLDNMLIGKYLGSAPLGFYNLAYKLLLFPINNIALVLGRVMFPSLSSIQSDKARTRSAYVRANKFIVTITLPLMVGLFILAPEFIKAFFGSKWEDAIPLVQILAIVGMMQPISHTTGWIYMSQGRTEIMFRWNLVYLAVTALGFVVGLRWGVEGVAAGYATTSYLLIYPGLAIPFRLVDLKIRHFMRQLVMIFISSGVMGITVLGTRYLLEKAGMRSEMLLLLLCVAVAIVTYSAVLYLLDRTILPEVLNLLKQARMKGSPATELESAGETKHGSGGLPGK